MSTSRVVKYALRGLFAGAALGLSGGLVAAGVNSGEESKSTATAAMWARKYPFVSSNAHVRVECEHLLTFVTGTVHMTHFMKNLDALLRLEMDATQATKVRIAWPAVASTYATKATDALRCIRSDISTSATLSHHLADLDVALETVNKIVKDTVYNIEMQVAHLLSQ